MTAVIAPQEERIIEHRVAAPKLLESQEDGVFRFEAVVSEVDFTNGNRRMYPRDVLWPAFQAMLLDAARHPGMVDHPDWALPPSLTDIGIAWESFWLEGNLIVGRGRTVDTVKGKALEAAIRAGLAVGFSTRGYGTSTEVQRDGQTVQVMETFSFSSKYGEAPGSVDAVLNPSVGHARIRSYTKEELEQMDEQLKAAQAATAAAEAAQATAEQALTEARAEVERLSGRIAELEESLKAAQAELGDYKSQHEAAALTGRIFELTGEHRFGAAIRNELDTLRQRGVAITAENVEALVTSITGLVESAATAAAEGAPRGVVSTDEDIEVPVETLTAEQREELEKAGLL